MPAKLAPRATFLSTPPPLTCLEQDGAVCPRGCKLSKPGLGSSLPVHHPRAPAPTPPAPNHSFSVPTQTGQCPRSHEQVGLRKNKVSSVFLFSIFSESVCKHAPENLLKTHNSWSFSSSISAGRSRMEPRNLSQDPEVYGSHFQKCLLGASAVTWEVPMGTPMSRSLGECGLEGLNACSPRQPGLGPQDIAWSARERLLSTLAWPGQPHPALLMYL